MKLLCMYRKQNGSPIGTIEINYIDPEFPKDESSIIFRLNLLLTDKFIRVTEDSEKLLKYLIGDDNVKAFLKYVWLIIAQ